MCNTNSGPTSHRVPLQWEAQGRLPGLTNEPVLWMPSPRWSIQSPARAVHCCPPPPPPLPCQPRLPPRGPSPVWLSVYSSGLHVKQKESKLGAQIKQSFAGCGPRNALSSWMFLTFICLRTQLLALGSRQPEARSHDEENSCEPGLCPSEKKPFTHDFMRSAQPPASTLPPSLGLLAKH